MPNRLITIQEFIADMRKACHSVALEESLTEDQEAKLLISVACVFGSQPMNMGNVESLIVI